MKDPSGIDRGDWRTGSTRQVRGRSTHWWTRSTSGRILQVAWEKVKRNRGAGGIDGEDLAAFEAELEANLERLHQRAQGWHLRAPTGAAAPDPQGGETGEVSARWASRRSTIGCVNRRYSTGWNRSSIRYSMKPTSGIGQEGPPRMHSERSGASWKQENEWVVDADLKDFLDRCSYYPPADLGSSKRSGIASGSFIFSPLRLPCETWMASSSPRLTRCNTVWRDTPRMRMASTMGT